MLPKKTGDFGKNLANGQTRRWPLPSYDFTYSVRGFSIKTTCFLSVKNIFTYFPEEIFYAVPGKLVRLTIRSKFTKSKLWRGFLAGHNNIEKNVYYVSEREGPISLCLGAGPVGGGGRGAMSFSVASRWPSLKYGSTSPCSSHARDERCVLRLRWFG
jgi:hypothetical protein